MFVAHSLGGIILKDVRHFSVPSISKFIADHIQALRRSQKCRERTKLVVFLGTPHRGSAYAGWGEIAANLAGVAFQDTNSRVLEALNVNGEVLDNIHEEFKTILSQQSIKVHSFQEAQGMSGMRGLHGKVRCRFLVFVVYEPFQTME